MSVYKYRIYCNTENQYTYTWNTIKPSVCPNNNTHSIDTDTICIVDTISNKNQLLETDVFKRVKVANATVIFSGHYALGSKSLYYDEIKEGSATIAVDPSISCNVLTVNNINDRAVHQSREYFSYVPGCSKLIYISGVLQMTLDPGIRSRIGVFDSHFDKTIDSKGNGHFVMCYNNTLYMVERTSTDGTDQTDITVEQSAWNIDPLNGTGKSGLSIDPTKGLLMLFEYGWLGLNQTRIGFMFHGNLIWAHIWDHTQFQKPYILYAKLPIRAEIKNISSANTSSSLRMICSSIAIESNSINNVSHGICLTFNDDSERIAVKNTWLPILSLRLSNAGNRRTLSITKLVIVTDVRPIKWRLILNAVLINPNWRPVGIHPDSQAEWDITAPIVGSSNGIQYGFPFESGIVSANFTETYVFTAPFEVSINSSIAGISDIITLEARGVNNSSTFNYSLDWIESY